MCGFGCPGKAGLMSGLEISPISSGEGLGPLVLRAVLAPCVRRGSLEPGEESLSFPAPFPFHSSALEHPAPGPCLGFVNNNKCRGSSPGISCSPVPCPPADVTERKDFRHGSKIVGAVSVPFLKTDASDCKTFLRHSKAPQLPEATECSKSISKYGPTTGTVDPSFRHHFLPLPFFTFTIADKRVVVWYENEKDCTRLGKRHFTFRKLPG